MSNFSVRRPADRDGRAGLRGHAGRRKIEWDGPNMKVTNIPEANEYLQSEYRKGWEL